MAAWPPDLTIDDTDMTAARWAFDKKEMAGHLTGTLPQIDWQFRPIVTSLRVAGVLAWTSSDNVDPYRQRAESRSVNYRGGDPTRRDLGLELDAAIRGHWLLTDWLTFQAGLEGGLLFPGHAFDDDHGTAMGDVGLARIRLGLVF
jgi:hypothetical protein